MSHVHRRVDGFCHRANSQRFDHVLFRAVLHVFHQFVHGRGDLARCTCPDAITELGDKAAEIFQFLGVRLFVNTIHECFGFLVFLDFSDSFGNLFVGEKHKFLDQLVGLFRAFEIHARGFSVLVNIETNLDPVESDGTVLETGGP